MTRASMEGAFGELTVLDKAGVREVPHRVTDAARVVADVYEGMLVLAHQEKQFAHVRLYQERDLADALVSSEASRLEWALTCARALGIEPDQLPTAVLVAQLGAQVPVGERRILLERLREVLEEVARTLPSGMVTSVRAGEVLVLWRPAPTRNPGLSALRLREFANQVRECVRQRLGDAVLVGTGRDVTDPWGLADAYREADRSLREGQAQGEARRPQTETGRILDAHCEALGALHDALATGTPDVVADAVDRALRTAEAYAGGDEERHRLLCAGAVNHFLAAAMAQGIDAAGLRRSLTRYLRECLALRSTRDVTAWIAKHLVSVVAGPSAVARGGGLHRVTAACAHIESHLESVLNRDAVARSVGISGSHLSRLFRQHRGMSFRAYVLRARMARARQLLAESRQTIYDIALEVGYSDTPAFTRAFTAHCRLTPRAYRERHSAAPCVGSPR